MDRKLPDWMTDPKWEEVENVEVVHMHHRQHHLYVYPSAYGVATSHTPEEVYNMGDGEITLTLSNGEKIARMPESHFENIIFANDGESKRKKLVVYSDPWTQTRRAYRISDDFKYDMSTRTTANVPVF